MPAGGYELAATQFGPGGGTSRDGRRCSMVLEPNSLPVGCESLEL
jgi:hypothetical protein